MARRVTCRLIASLSCLVSETESYNMSIMLLAGDKYKKDGKVIAMKKSKGFGVWTCVCRIHIGPQVMSLLP